MKETGESSLSCPRCGAALPADAVEGLCPRCLIEMNLATQTRMTGDESHSADAGAHSSQPPDPQEIGKYFPQLEILECLGRGGMGVVYKARQPKLNRFVALKILAPGKEKDPKFAERFELEAQALAKLDHPNIVTVHDFGEADGLYYLLMEFVDGVNLRQLLHNGHGKLKPKEALAIVPHICEALQYAHDHGVVHRDIKPENVLMDKEGRVKIADFGIAKILGREGTAAGLTGEKKAIGTPRYMAPEQMEKPLEVDHRSDIYSLGVVFYEMLTGELPVGKFPVPSRKVQVDVRLDEVVLHALEKSPELRYQTATQFRTEVETIVENPDTNEPTAKSGMVRMLEIFSGITFTSTLAIKTANLSALGFLGCLGFLAFITLPPTRIFFALFGFFGFFGMAGLAFLFEIAAGGRTRKQSPDSPRRKGSPSRENYQYYHSGPSRLRDCWMWDPRIAWLFFLVPLVITLPLIPFLFQQIGVHSLWLLAFDAGGLAMALTYVVVGMKVRRLKITPTAKAGEVAEVLIAGRTFESPGVAILREEALELVPIAGDPIPLSRKDIIDVRKVIWFNGRRLWTKTGLILELEGGARIGIALARPTGERWNLALSSNRATERQNLKSESNQTLRSTDAASLVPGNIQKRVNDVARALRAVALANVFVGALMSVFLIIFLLSPPPAQGTSGGPEVKLAISPLAWLGPLSLLGGIIILIGATKVRRLRDREWAIGTCILAMLTPPGCIIGFFVGIWGLVVLLPTEVRDAFETTESMSSQTTSSDSGGRAAGNQQQRGVDAAAPTVILARWTARISGTLLLAFWGSFVLAEGLPAIATQPGGVQLNFAALALMLTGFVVGWWREGTSAVLIASGWTLWHISEGHFDWNLFQTPLLVAALYALCWWATHGRRTAVMAATIGVFAVVLVLGRLFVPSNVFVRGTVTEASTGAVITNASLTLLPASQSATEDTPLSNARTGTNGEFRLYVGWHSPRKELAIDAPGYQTLTTNLGPREVGQRRIKRDFQLQANEEPQTADSSVPAFSPVRQASLISPQGRIAELLDLDTGLRATNTVFGENDRETHAWIRSNKLDVLGVVEHGQSAALCFDMAVIPVNSNLWEQATPEQVLTNWNLSQQEPKKITPISPVTDKTDSWFFRTREDGNGILKITDQNDNPLGVNIRYKLIEMSSSTNDALRIQLKDVPLRDAIQALAKQNKLNVVFDPQLELDRGGPNGRTALETVVNLEWENVTAPAALETLLENYGLELTVDPESGIARVAKKSPTPTAEVDADFQTPPPVVVRTIPESGASDVDPALSELRVTFSKPMRDGSWSWSAWGEENYPETTGEPRYLEDGRTCVLPVKLEAGKVYALWLNSEKFKNFLGADGRPAVPYLLIFETKN